MKFIDHRARLKIYQMLAGTIKAALNEHPDHSWLFKDFKGDKIAIDDRRFAREEARFVLSALDDLISIHQDALDSDPKG